MTIDLALVRTLLAHPFEFPWSWQGFGMFRLYLSKELRLHVWSPTHATKDVTTLHTHPWHFTSTVLQGEIMDRRYRAVSLVDHANEQPDTHTEQRIRCGEGGCAVAGTRPVRLERMLPTDVVKAGCVYSRRAHEIHESIPTPGTITIVRRHFLEDTEHALVYHRIGTPWISAEPRRATREEIRQMAEIALAVEP
jgi:hypothetical protein